MVGTSPSQRPLVPAEPDIDENGVDLAQVRAMLDLTPAERLERVFGFMSALVAARDGHGITSGSR